MLETVMKVISTTTGRVHQLACKTVLEVAISASGVEGCSGATQSEIDVFLGALQSPSMTVRETALQVYSSMAACIYSTLLSDKMR